MTKLKKAIHGLGRDAEELKKSLQKYNDQNLQRSAVSVCIDANTLYNSVYDLPTSRQLLEIVRESLLKRVDERNWPTDVIANVKDYISRRHKRYHKLVHAKIKDKIMPVDGKWTVEVIDNIVYVWEKEPNDSEHEILRIETDGLNVEAFGPIPFAVVKLFVRETNKIRNTRDFQEYQNSVSQ